MTTVEGSEPDATHFEICPMARIRSNQRDEAAATDTAAAAAAAARADAALREIDFPHFWRQLRVAGWTYKKPTGLSTQGGYASPTGDQIFYGEAALVAHALESGLLDVDAPTDEDAHATAKSTTTTTNSGSEATSSSSANSPTVVVKRKSAKAKAQAKSASLTTSKTTRPSRSTSSQGVAASTPRRRAPGKRPARRQSMDSDSDNSDGAHVSQIDTSIHLSQRTLNTLFGDDSEDDLSQTAVPRAFDLSPSLLECDASQREAATSLQLLSEASGLESETEQPTAPSPPTTASPVARGGRVLRPRNKIKKDVNYVPEEENLSDYESYSSSESDGEAVAEDADSPSRDDSEEEDDEISDSDAVQLDSALIDALQLDSTTQSKKAQEEALRGMQWTPVSSTFENDAPAYCGLGSEEAGPVPELQALCGSPIDTFLYFMPKSLWVLINTETNRYGLQQVDRRAAAIRSKQAPSRRETLVQIGRRLRAKPSYQTHEILHVIGLLVARMLCPQKRRFGAHWTMVEDGAVPAGNFGRFMARNRCTDILRDLHIVDNEAPRNRDKLWKLRPVVDKLQKQFLAGWTLPAVFSFDEGVLPATSKRNTTRMFMPDKPHRYGSKMFMMCDPRSAYCHRFEMYAGKRKAGEGSPSHFDNKTGAIAVVRNLKIVLGSNRHPWHAVVVDRFYSSVLLAIELLKMQVYVIGTVMTNRLGFDKAVKEGRTTRPASIPRGTFTFSRSVAVPSMVAFHWWDRKPVHYLCTGAVMSESTIGRKVKRVGAITVPCPAPVTDYQRWMGGVDVHDQLRLQSYSLQTSTKFTKYYKSLFLGMVDMAMVNAYISHKEAAKLSGTAPMKRAEWYVVLQNQLLQLKAEDFAGVVATPPTAVKKRKRSAVRLTHAPEQAEDWVMVSGVQKRRQRSCKVCALLRTDPKKKSFATTFFCERCSVDNAKCWLCNKIRRRYKGVAKTCFEIWHDDFDAGQAIPQNLGKRVVLRRPGQKAGKRQKTRRELQLPNDEEGEDDSQGENDGGGGSGGSGSDFE